MAVKNKRRHRRMKVKQCEKGEAEMKLKETKKAKIGIYTMGLKAYWAQFAGLHERMMEYGNFNCGKNRKDGCGSLFLRVGRLRGRGKKMRRIF